MYAHFFHNRLHRLTGSSHWYDGPGDDQRAPEVALLEISDFFMCMARHMIRMAHMTKRPQ